jgi:hypothetical protein
LSNLISLTRDKEIRMPKGSKYVHDDIENENSRVEVIDSQCGVALGGVPGGGDGELIFKS